MICVISTNKYTSRSQVAHGLFRGGFVTATAAALGHHGQHFECERAVAVAMGKVYLLAAKHGIPECRQALMCVPGIDAAAFVALETQASCFTPPSSVLFRCRVFCNTLVRVL